RDEERHIMRGVPGLSDLPVLGRLFASTHTENQETDIILVLTPHIIRVLDLTEADLRAFRVGRETASGALLDLPPQAPPPPVVNPPPPVAPPNPEAAPLPQPGASTPIRPPDRQIQ